MPDPYESQRKTKAESQRRILDVLRNKPATFSELRTLAKVSAPILAKHLKELRSKHLVTQRVEEGDVLYESTDKARKVEESARTAIVLGLQKMRSLPQDEKNLNFLTDIIRLAKEKPEYFEAIMDWLAQLTSFLISSGKVGWLESQEGRREFQEAINAKMPKPSSEINSPAELRKALGKLLEVIKDIVAAETKETKK